MVGISTKNEINLSIRLKLNRLSFSITLGRADLYEDFRLDCPLIAILSARAGRQQMAVQSS